MDVDELDEAIGDVCECWADESDSPAGDTDDTVDDEDVDDDDDEPDDS